MQLSKSQQEKLLTKVNNLWKDKVCEICTNNDWQLLDRFYELREYNQGSMILGAPLIPLLVVQCTTCGHVRFQNALAIGAVDPKTGGIVDG